MRETIRYWLKDYVADGELEGLVNLMAHIVRQHAKGAFVGGLIFGFISAVILLKYFS